MDAKHPTIEKFDKRYNSKEIEHDLHHIREDLKNLIELEDAGSITGEQLIFYAIRMHDFDNNNELDGLEIMQMIHHQHEVEGAVREAKEGPNEEEIINSVDRFLKRDLNLDGFVSFPEWITVKE